MPVASATVAVTYPAKVTQLIHRVDQEEPNAKHNLRVLLQSIANLRKHVDQRRGQQHSGSEAQQERDQRREALPIALGTKQWQDTGEKASQPERQNGQQFGFVLAHAGVGFEQNARNVDQRAMLLVGQIHRSVRDRDIRDGCWTTEFLLRRAGHSQGLIICLCCFCGLVFCYVATD
uniref:(northern house mosquito) hypothetical protein n=1 Tax=Culex pipiens TaxID=7175 RepID=A0A8D8BYH3_CULPI